MIWVEEGKCWILKKEIRHEPRTREERRGEVSDREIRYQSRRREEKRLLDPDEIRQVGETRHRP